MGNPAAGILVLLLALWLLLAYFDGRLEWLFHLNQAAQQPGGPGDTPGPAPWRPSTVWNGRVYA